MDKAAVSLVQKLLAERHLELAEYQYLIDAQDEELAAFLATLAVSERKRIYGNKVFIRGLIEISNICKNDCLYCGIRKSNLHCDRYRLEKDDILACCREGYELGFRTFVLQGGEDG